MRLEQNLLTKIEEAASDTEIINAAKYINLSYSIFSTDEQLWEEVKRAFGEKYTGVFDVYANQIIANSFINELLLKYYPCERTVKYALVNSLKNKHDTVLFEMPVLDSRVDVCRINGNSYAYEIKTEFDSFKRLKKQIDDYSRVYEYIFVVIPKNFYQAVVEIIPYFCGIRILRQDSNDGKIYFTTKRKAIKSPNIDSISQLSSLSKGSLGFWLTNKGIKKIPPSKEDRINFIISKYTPKTINYAFKQIVKYSYKDNWTFLLKHYNEILPIDIQAFFNSSLEPRLLYLKNKY
jgi:hypothetical protein